MIIQSILEIFAGLFFIEVGMYVMAKYFITTHFRKQAVMLGLVLLVPVGFVIYLITSNFLSFIYTLAILAVSLPVIERYNSAPMQRPTEWPRPILFEDRVKHDLGLGFIKTIKVKLPDSLKWIGGFMMPVLPLFYVVNIDSTWNQRREEAVIHELMHIKILTNGYLFFMVTIPLIIAGLAKMALPSLSVDGLGGTILLIVLLTVIMVLNEYITDKETHKYAVRCGIYTERITLARYKKYFMIYGLYIGTILLLKLVLRWLF